ncbi:hypothetical protein CTKA_00468 [Chthonomonas calidirosea]|uniref:Uncharacterized conserved protein (Some members contain a von Willebrand factor type A (VWA) domain) n=1 Tax=Chthonomonas calidirosea (strain DSM 23976 / ICMP 18418 / T49) TaxID=1303518 RepID=S0EVU3_CHTCT|nr:DUF58 domain-containing protein [Chthonomonas calidirosea]CCW34512.1 Uncharacterized conserved protein (some members contain a von Willebrand factor type A (vWA) domain) [Chthonomonas calidirosea T49]CEK14572.1 hypothetical protein CTKA_00468 [Chthonomonas calidirosea]
MQHSKWIVLGFGALCLITVATVIPPAQHLYYMAAILITLPAISYFAGWTMLRGLTFQREVPSAAMEGEEIDIVYTISNDTRFMRFFLSTYEEFPPWLTPIEEEPLFNVPAKSTIRVARRVRCLRRGVYNTTSFHISAMDPLGVFAFTQSVPTEGELIVYPSPYKLSQAVIGGGEQFGLQQIVASFRQGTSVDLAGVRPYVPGDPLRRIHWRQTARTGQLNVVEFEEMQSSRLVLLLDAHRGCDRGMEPQTPLEYMIKVAAALLTEALEAGAWSRLCITDGRVPAGFLDTGGDRGQTHRHLLLGELARVEATGEIPLSDVISAIYPSLTPGLVLVLITTTEDPVLPQVLSDIVTTLAVRPFVIGFDVSSFPEHPPTAGNFSHFLSSLAATEVQTLLLGYQAEAGLVIKEHSYEPRSHASRW